MLTIKTTRFGEIEVNPVDVVEMPDGLIGFPELKRYVLLDRAPGSPFRWMQSLDDGSVAFVLVSPLEFMPDYVIEATEAEVAGLGILSEDDAVVAVILTMGTKPTANLKGPLVFSQASKRGRQLINPNVEYTTRFPLPKAFVAAAHQTKGA